jgi:cytochrome c
MMVRDRVVARSLSILALVAGTLLIGLDGCQVTDKTGEKIAAAPAADPVAHGKYLVSITACNDCHTPMMMTAEGPRPDMTKMLAGHPAAMVMPPPPTPVGPWVWFGAGTNTAFAGPWGVSYAINLTPSSSGLSAWNEEMFVKAFRTGKHMGTARPIMPPMPLPAYSNMTDEDLKAVWAYLQTVPPIDNLVPDAVVAEMTPPGGAAAAGH